MNNIRKIREEKKVNRSQLSRISGVPLRTLEDWESGRNKPTDVYQLLKIAHVLECSVEDLVSLDD